VSALGGASGAFISKSSGRPRSPRLRAAAL
jgi:hypothetical protein